MSTTTLLLFVLIQGATTLCILLQYRINQIVSKRLKSYQEFNTLTFERLNLQDDAITALLKASCHDLPPS